MIILGIETSCDETAAAIVENGKKILSSVVASSANLHKKTGGIIPEQAARKQTEMIIPVINEAIERSHKNVEEIDSLAVTYGPGLIGSLLVGVEGAKTLSFLWQKPIIPVNHLVGHLYANWLGKKTPSFPAIGFVVSGGHTDLVYIKDHGKIEWIGGTRDDAAGEAFDKIARLLALPYPGGPSISKAAQKAKGDKKLTFFPRPLIESNDFDLSFSGLKTAVYNEIKEKKLTSEEKYQYSAEAQEAIVDCLVAKASKAVEKYKPASFLLAGGVAANKRLREKLKDNLKKISPELNLFIPDIKLCTDNAAYIATCAFYLKRSSSWKSLAANPQLTIAP